MDRDSFEKKTGVTVLIPEAFSEDCEEKIDVTLPCGHDKRCKIKSLLKRKPTCTTCKPRQKIAKIEDPVRDELMSKLEGMTQEELLTLMSTFSTRALKGLFA